MNTNALQESAERFLKTGEFPDHITAEELAGACDRTVRALTQESAQMAVQAGNVWVEAARSHGGILFLTALRASAWAHLVAGQYGKARDQYLEARNLLKGDKPARARIDRVLIDVYMYLGDLAESRKRANRALVAFRRAGLDADVAKTEMNLANLLHRQDRHAEADRLYDRAARFFQDRGPTLAAALCYYNRANTQVQLFDFARASDLYAKARTMFGAEDQKLHATSCLYGLAWLHMLEGDFHQALLELAQCEHEYQRGRHSRELVVSHLDKAEAYLGLNLFSDALAAAREARRGADRLKLQYESAKAAFFEGRALLALGKRGAARSRLTRAARGFEATGNMGFLTAVELTQVLSSRDQSEQLARIHELRTRFRQSQLPLWEGICDLEILAKWPDEPGAQRRVAKNPAVAAIPHLLARRHTLAGDRMARHNRMRGAARHWTLAADVLDLVRAKLPPIEMRSSYFAGRSEPHQKMIAFEAERHPLEAAVWSERFKTAGIWAVAEPRLEEQPVRKRVEENLARLAHGMTALSAAITDSEGKRAFPQARTAGPLRHLERRVRDELAGMAHKPSLHAESVPLADAIRALSSDMPIVGFHVALGDVLAFIHYGGRSRTYRYADGVSRTRQFLARWRHQVEFAAVRGSSVGRTRLTEEHDLLSDFAHWFLPPLELPEDADRLLLLPEGLLFGVPWSVLPLAGERLLDRYELMLAPSLTHFRHASAARPSSDSHRIFVGSRSGLPYLNGEIAAVRRRLDGPTLRIHDPCQRSDWPNSVDEGIWHFAGHAALRRDNPFYSSLLLDDGPLFAADLRLSRNQVGLITLAACRTGQHTGLPGEEASALVRSLLEMGARNVVASHWAISDRSTSVWIDHFYENYLDGAPAARAVRHAARSVREQFPSVCDWGAFSLFGAG